MAKFTIPKDLDEYLLKLSEFGDDSEDVAKAVVYQGASAVADAIKGALKTLPIQEGEDGMPPYAHDGAPLYGVTRKQRGDLIDSMGLAPIQEFKQGYINTKVGWDGYGSVKTKAYPNGIPNQLLMRAVESGTSFRKKNPVVRRATMNVREQALDKMKKEFDEQSKKYFG